MKRNLMMLAVALMFVACASSTWDNMSESDIVIWKELGVSMDDANEMNEEGLVAPEFAKWKKAGITDMDLIFEWKEEKFSAVEAGRWTKANFDVDEAVESRGRGLQPVHKGTEVKEEPKAVEKKAEPVKEATPEVAPTKEEAAPAAE